MGRASSAKRRRKEDGGQSIWSDNAPLILTDYLVGFFDVLGQSTKLQQLKRVPTTPEEREAAVVLLKQTIGVVLGVRRLFDDFFEAMAQPTPFARSLPPDARRHVMRATAARVLHWGLSDSVVVAIPLIETDNPAAAVNGVRRALLAAGGMWLLALSAGHPLRGGIDVGVAMQIGPNEVYGPALDRAYHLECDVAGAPRIAVGPTCTEYLNFIRSRPVANQVGEVAQHAADECLRMLHVDEDGQTIVHGLGPVFQSLSTVANQLGASGGIAEAVRKAHATVKDQLAGAQKANNDTLVRRYEQLQRYFDAHASSWDA